MLVVVSGDDNAVRTAGVSDAPFFYLFGNTVVVAVDVFRAVIWWV